jgi:hypothetical protein
VRKKREKRKIPKRGEGGRGEKSARAKIKQMK